jgi:hypothetical protein
MRAAKEDPRINANRRNVILEPSVGFWLGVDKEVSAETDLIRRGSELPEAPTSNLIP